jgi:hypothetical protein
MSYDWAGDGLLIMAHTKQKPDAATWTAMCRTFAAGAGTAGELRCIVFTDGGGPTGAQREEMAGITRGMKYRACVVSGAPVVRFIVSSLAFINPSIKSFLPSEWQRGLDHLGFRPAELSKVEQAVEQFARRHGKRFATLNAVLAPHDRRA